MTIFIEYDNDSHFCDLMINIFLKRHVIQKLLKIVRKKYFIHHPERYFINYRLNASVYKGKKFQ